MKRKAQSDFRIGNLRALACGLVIATSGGSAFAESPNVWQRVSNPLAEQQHLLHQKANEVLLGIGSDPFTGLQRESIRVLLETLHSALDVRLRTDLGQIYQLLERHRLAIATLREVVETAPDTALAHRANLSIAFSHAKLNQQELERDAYRAFLVEEVDPERRVIPTLNLAEAEMRSGNLSGAIEGYQEANRLANEYQHVESMRLSLWGLAVAYDRNGETGYARETTKRALVEDPNEYLITLDPNVFFVPAYERYWYLALSATIRAEETPALRTKAATYWKNYVRAAEVLHPGDRFLPIARHHLSILDRTMGPMSKAVAKTPAKKK